MGGEALGLGKPPELLQQARLADACVAPDIDDLAPPPAEATSEDSLELLDLGLAADKGAAASRRCLDHDPAQAPDPRGRVETLERDLAHWLTQSTPGER